MADVITLLRADKRIFQVGDPIRSAGEYSDRFKGASKEVEESLEKLRPRDKTPRAECLFLYEQERPAKKHWIYLKEGKLYEVRIAAADVLHRGDNAFMDQMMKAIESGRRDPVEDLARRYWTEEVSREPIIEVLALAGTVTRVVEHSEEMRIEAFKSFMQGEW